MKDDFKFGIEIEFADSRLDLVANRINKYNKYNLISDAWDVRFEHIVSVTDGEKNVVGGEIVSPILRNNKLSYLAIKNILTELKKEKAKINGETGFHMHVDALYLGENLEYLNLLELWMAYENVIYQYGFNPYHKGRVAILDFAKPLYLFKRRYLETIDYLRKYNVDFFEASDYLDLEDINALFDKRYGLNYRNIIHSDYYGDLFDNKQTIEFRCCDGTLDYNKIINIISFFKALVDASKFEQLDFEYLRYRNNLSYEFRSLEEFSKCNGKDLEELLSLLKLDSETEEKCIKYYYKK
ncbi:MAG: amidoligase family protein [bacterium]